MNKPLVTIITATYNLIKANRKEYFLQAIESVKNQTYENIEHIIIDGGSNDGTLELIQSTGLKYISEPDKGIFDAFNKGVLNANGKYIAFLNSDDFFCNNKAVELSVEALEKEGADFSFANTNLLDENDNLKTVFNHNISKIFTRMPFCHQTMFTKKEVLEKENYFDLAYKSASDYDFIIRLILKKYKYVSIDETIVSFRLAGESAINVDLSISEQIKIHYNLHLPYAKFNKTELVNLIKYEALPLRVIFKLKLDFKSLKYYLLANLNCFFKEFIRFRICWDKSKCYLEILGRKIYSESETQKKINERILNLVVWKEIGLE